MEAAVHASWGDKEKTMKAAKMAKFYYYVTDGKKAAKNSAVAGWAADPKECEFWSLMLVRGISNLHLFTSLPS